MLTDRRRASGPSLLHPGILRVHETHVPESLWRRWRLESEAVTGTILPQFLDSTHCGCSGGGRLAYTEGLHLTQTTRYLWPKRCLIDVTERHSSAMQGQGSGAVELFDCCHVITTCGRTLLVAALRQLAVGHAPGLDSSVEALTILAPKTRQLLTVCLLPDNLSILVACSRDTVFPCNLFRCQESPWFKGPPSLLVWPVTPSTMLRRRHGSHKEASNTWLAIPGIGGCSCLWRSGLLGLEGRPVNDAW